MERNYRPLMARDAVAGWEKYEGNPVLGGVYGTCFDVCLLDEDGVFRMWFSWRPVRLIAYVESADGINWTEPMVVLKPDPLSDWENYEVNRPTVIKKDGLYHMWYTGQTYSGLLDPRYCGTSAIGYATSEDGLNWTKKPGPVLKAERPWEKIAVMCPHVLFEDGVYRMWYSGGEQYEPDAIGYATSPDGVNWTKYEGNPILTANPDQFWEHKKVTASFVMKLDDWYHMFYIGFDTYGHSTVGAARSRDGVTNWERHPDNPILAGTDGTWDHNGICKPFILRRGDLLYLWYNGCNHKLEEIGLAYHKGLDLGYDE